MENEWDNRETIETEFPRDKWEYIPIKNPDEARMKIVTLTFTKGDILFGQARWFGPNDGMIFIRKDATGQEFKEVPKKKWWQRLFDWSISRV